MSECWIRAWICLLKLPIIRLIAALELTAAKHFSSSSRCWSLKGSCPTPSVNTFIIQELLLRSTVMLGFIFQELFSDLRELVISFKSLWLLSLRPLVLTHTSFTASEYQGCSELLDAPEPGAVHPHGPTTCSEFIQCSGPLWMLFDLIYKQHRVC